MPDKNDKGEEMNQILDQSSGPGEDAPDRAEEPVPPLSGDEEQGPGSAGSESADARKPSRSKKKPKKARQVDAKEALNRLLEKNQIISKLDRAVKEKDRQLKDLNDKWLRSVAEFENYRKRSRKEWELLKQQSKTEVILEVLYVVDDFERAFSVVEDSDASEFVRGIRLIYNNLLQVLEKFDVKEIEAHQVPFDPNVHMAVSQIETEDVESGFVAEVIQKGYRIEETVIRPAKVIVAK